jgi:hypothetical protein
MRIPILVCGALALCLLTAGCANWTRGGAPYTAANLYTVTVPGDWLYHPNFGGEYTATKEGVFLQQLVVAKQPLKEPLPQSKRLVTPEMTTLELAEALLDDARANRALLGLEVLENSPTQLDGKPAVRLVLRYSTEDGLDLSRVSIARVHGDSLYVLRLTAPTRHYFERDLAVFDEAVRNFRFVGVSG